MDDLFLAHHGVKGQKWGVRNDDYIPTGRSQRVRTPAEKRKSAMKKIAIGAAAVAAIGIGAIAYNQIKTNSVASKLGQSYVESIFRDADGLSMSSKAAQKLMNNDLAKGGWTQTGPTTFSWSK